MQVWCKSSWSGPVRFMYGPEDCHELQLTYLCYINKSCYLLGRSFIQFPVCEWNDSQDIMLLSTVVSWRYKKFARYCPQDKQINIKKLRVPPRAVGITANHVQYIIHTGLCRVCWLLVFVHWAVWVTEWAIVTTLHAAVDRSRDTRFFPSMKWPDRLWNHPASYSEGMGIFPWG